MSFQVCCVTGCMNRGRGLHRFPNPEKDPDRFKIWKLFSGVECKGMTESAIVNTRRICRSHFSVQFHYPRNKLCRLAVPTLLPGTHLPEKNCDTQSKITRDILIEDDPVEKSVDAVEHGPLITEDQGDISMYHDDDPQRPVAEARNDPNNPVDKSVYAVEHGPPITEDQGDISMYHDDEPLRPVVEARNDSNDPVDKSVDAMEHGPPITEDQGEISMYHDDDPLRPVAEAGNDSNDPVAVEHGSPITEDQGDPVRPVAEARNDSITLGVPVHRFPHPEKQPHLFAAWVSAIGDKLKETDQKKIYNNKRICHHHFDPRDQMETGSHLKRSAIPSVHLNYDPVDKSVYVVEHAPPITEDQGDVSMYHDEDPLRLVAEAGNDSNDPVDKSVYAVEHGPPIMEDQGDVSMYYDDDPLRLVAEAGNDSTIEDEEADGPPDGTDECYFCNVCKESIKGFRYTCVQCEDWDLCGACEARAAHAFHYVLRIPSPKPYKEIQAVLTAVRQQLINKNIIPGKADSVKEEPNSESEDAAEPDTLDWDEDFYEKDNICIELEDGEHPRKRLRPEASSTHSDQDLTTPESPKHTHDRTTDVLFNPDDTKSSKDIQPRTLPNNNPSIQKPGLIRLTGTTPETTETILLPTIAPNSKRTLTLKPISRLPLGARVIKLSACFGKKKMAAIRRKKIGDHPPPRKLLHPGPSRTRSNQDLTTPESSKLTHNRTTHVHFNHDVTNSAKDIQPGTLPNDTPTIPESGLNRLIGTMPQTTGTLLPTRVLNNSRTTPFLEPIPRQSLGLSFVKKTVFVGNPASRLSEEKTAMSSPSVDKSSSQRPDHATAVSPLTTRVTSLERAAMSDPKADSNWCLRILQGKSKVSVRLKPVDDSKME